jgi:hypothetical protein
MPTIDQLAPAVAAADSDEHIVSQAGTALKMTRAQILAGVQTQLAVPSNTLIGRASPGVGAPESLSIGANLLLTNGTLSASATPYVVGALPSGTVPASGDLIALSQSGTNTAVPYSRFLSGLPAISNIDGSQMLVTATGSKVASKLADFAAGTLPLTGGTLTGPLMLAATPSSTMQAAPKAYVDGQVAGALPLTGGTLSGPLTLSGDPATPAQAATKNYVDSQTGGYLTKTGGTLTGTLTLGTDPTASMQAATKQYVDARVLRSGDTLTGALTLAADPVAPLQASTKNYTDIQVATALPKAGGTLTGGLSLPADPSSPLQAATKRYVDNQVATSLPLGGGTVSGPITLSADPTAAMHAAPKQYVDSHIGGGLPMSGGTLTGPLTLAAAPITPLGAATKQYVDTSPGNATGVINVKTSPYNAQLDGVADDTAAFKAAYQAATAGSVIYVPNGIVVLQNPNSWGIPLTKWVKWVVDGTMTANGTSLADAIPGGAGPASMVLPGVVVGNNSASAEVSQGSSQSTDFAVSRSAYIVNHTGGPTTGVVSANSRTDTIIYNSPNNYIWGGVDRMLWCGVQTGSASAPAQHVGRYIQTIRQAVGTGSSGAALPQPQLWAACFEYRDTTGKQSSVTNASITAEMDWFGNGPDDGRSRQIQSLVVGQHSLAGAPVEVSTVVGVYLAAGHSGRAYTVFGVGIPFSTAVLDTSNATQLTGAAAIRMASGHAIAFEPTATYRLAFDSTTNVLRWYQGALSFVVGKGMSVGFQTVCTTNTTLPSYAAGNIVFLAGTGTYTITLPSAATVAAGTGYTFSAPGTGTATIAPAGTDGIDNWPVTLRQNDRYSIVSDGSSSWREIFRTNMVNPRFVGTPVLPSYSVAALPSAVTAGAKAFATNGRKPNDAAGAGTGVEIFSDGTRWISVCSGTQVQS